MKPWRGSGLLSMARSHVRLSPAPRINILTPSGWEVYSLCVCVCVCDLELICGIHCPYKFPSYTPLYDPLTRHLSTDEDPERGGDSKGQVDAEEPAVGTSAEKHLGHRATAKRLQEEGETAEIILTRTTTLLGGFCFKPRRSLRFLLWVFWV